MDLHDIGIFLQGLCILASGYYIYFRIGQRGLKEKRVLSQPARVYITWLSLAVLGVVFPLNSDLNLKHWGSFAFVTDNWFHLLLDFLCLGGIIFLPLWPDRSYHLYGAPRESFMTAVMVALHDLNQLFCEIAERKLRLINQNAVLQIGFSSGIHSLTMKPDQSGLLMEHLAAGIEKYYRDNPEKWNPQEFQIISGWGKWSLVIGAMGVLMGLVPWAMSLWS